MRNDTYAFIGPCEPVTQQSATSGILSNENKLPYIIPDHLQRRNKYHQDSGKYYYTGYRHCSHVRPDLPYDLLVSQFILYHQVTFDSSGKDQGQPEKQQYDGHNPEPDRNVSGLPGAERLFRYIRNQKQAGCDQDHRIDTDGAPHGVSNGEMCAVGKNVDGRNGQADRQNQV